jgi:hypothetical protein
MTSRDLGFEGLKISGAYNISICGAYKISIRHFNLISCLFMHCFPFFLSRQFETYQSVATKTRMPEKAIPFQRLGRMVRNAEGFLEPKPSPKDRVAPVSLVETFESGGRRVRHDVGGGAGVGGASGASDSKHAQGQGSEKKHIQSPAQGVPKATTSAKRGGAEPPGGVFTSPSRQLLSPSRVPLDHIDLPDKAAVKKASFAVSEQDLVRSATPLQLQFLSFAVFAICIFHHLYLYLSHVISSQWNDHPHSR